MSVIGNSHLASTSKDTSSYNSLVLIPAFQRDLLYRRIEATVDGMFEAGLYAEVKQIISQYHKVPRQLGKTLGYAEFVEYAKQNDKKRVPPQPGRPGEDQGPH
jgi:tRNA A37 N6-isopentenylltransferase MiaA